MFSIFYQLLVFSECMQSSHLKLWLKSQDSRIPYIPVLECLYDIIVAEFE